MTKAIKHFARYQGAIVGMRRSPRPYKFAVVGHGNEAVDHDYAYNYKPTSVDRQNFDYNARNALRTPGEPYIHPTLGPINTWKAKEIDEAKERSAGGWNAYVERERQRKIGYFEEAKTNGKYKPHVLGWSMSAHNAEKMSRTFHGCIIDAIVPVEN
jgi:hypothetical protein